ncbi:MAG: hypothetical protein QM820_65065 [Minicystis sp.]
MCFPAGPSWPAPKPGDTVKPGDISDDMKSSCSGKSCHAGGFIRQRTDNDRYCALLKAAFLPGGAMNGEGIKFPSKNDCIKWMKAMKCDPPDSTAFCSTPGVSE